ncbi:NAD(+) diphosphatase [Microbacterium azadirachtae]|uniref:NAD(+) diphosphatase n=1 Tax=Microbacterium azadirachtae TaxID=582680 RepID=UPI00087E52B1|nr:NAD(+) diphosphatase [Microbacterium azadirachtae]SDM26964.1 NAD+ diphosphatase [Microbacterium azadirachtae]SEG49673.1 NAD+ diphosphatase [Microbacterium azadirachtae]SEG50399.1 NAD+ diphosphatase [Microbacterium azadirachtae]
MPETVPEPVADDAAALDAAVLDGVVPEGASLDRAGEWREDPDAIPRLRADGRTGVLVVRERRVPLGDDGLILVPAGDPVLARTREWALLGRRPDGTGLLLALQDPEDDTDADGSWAPRWSDLREALPVVDAADGELVVAAIALAGWLRDAGFCPACGHPAELRQNGWSRHCVSCGREHFPRTDPAVIVAVQSADGERLLLGANAQWKGRFHSCFAGFVEAGESLETTVHREIFEEAGVRVRDLRYFASQPWPFPRSLMVGFHATAVDEQAAHGDGEEIIDVRWLTRAEIGSALAGSGPVGLPGAASIAHRLIVDWYRR